MLLKLVTHSHSPVDSICMAIAIMKEKEPIAFVAGLSRQEKEKMILEILKSRLTGALEFASFEFILEDVSRAFTHQLVRHRMFHFSQQSMRFFEATNSGFRMPKVSERNEELIQAHVALTRETYKTLIGCGCPTEDARSILPTNICTKIMFGANFRGLIDLAEVRLCYQAQGEFQEAMQLIKKEVLEVDEFLGSLLMPACKRSGRCEFKSVYDRKCPIETTLTKGGE